mmetsp:Transcript_20285/g.51365  ORF Transcript_20285/g.51365 Transcript_20285/m.51365 type:complete len:251 (+) Transcript_20285:651-1403(+)
MARAASTQCAAAPPAAAGAAGAAGAAPTPATSPSLTGSNIQRVERMRATPFSRVSAGSASPRSSSAASKWRTNASQWSVLRPACSISRQCSLRMSMSGASSCSSSGPPNANDMTFSCWCLSDAMLMPLKKGARKGSARILAYIVSTIFFMLISRGPLNDLVRGVVSPSTASPPWKDTLLFSSFEVRADSFMMRIPPFLGDTGGASAGASGVTGAGAATASADGAALGCACFRDITAPIFYGTVKLAFTVD